MHFAFVFVFVFFLSDSRFVVLPHAAVLIDIFSVPPLDYFLACDVLVFLVVVDCRVPLCRHAPSSKESGALHASE